MILTPKIALSLWHKALKEEVGLRIPIEFKDLTMVKKMMYESRQKSGDPELAELSLYIAPEGKEVWIVKKAQEAP